MQGIYEIRNTVTNNFYIGRSVSVESRWHQHMSDLKAHKHDSKALQADWDAYGPSAFTFRILEITSDEETTIQRELELIRQHQPIYNTAGIPERQGERALAAVRKQPRPRPEVKGEMLPQVDVMITEEELGVYRCECCGEPMLVERTEDGYVFVEATQSRVQARFWAYILADNGKLDAKLASLPLPGEGQMRPIKLTLGRRVIVDAD
jgi:predicted GIY-YIG superfamily endonuclease